MTYSSFGTLEQKLHDKIGEGIKLTFLTRKAKNFPFARAQQQQMRKDKPRAGNFTRKTQPANTTATTADTIITITTNHHQSPMAPSRPMSNWLVLSSTFLVGQPTTSCANMGFLTL
jgi:hypothetical protein